VIVLVLNAGSSSVKTALFDVRADDERLLARGAVTSLGRLKTGTLRLEDSAGAVLVERSTPNGDAAAATGLLLQAVASQSLPRPESVGHRLVHGGPDRFAPERYDTKLRSALDSLTHYAPIHLPIELGVIDAAERAYPDLPQVVCYDTGFHRDLPEVTRRLPLPRDMHDRGVRRYGFHGLSYEGIVRSVGAKQLGRAVLAHLGSGASMAAVKDGMCIDTTMGLTPTGGLVMGTRTGDLDPGVVVHLLDRFQLTPRALDELLNDHSGLLAVSETTSDMKKLLDVSDTDPRAALAVEMFCYVAKKYVGALAAALGGLDSLVFTGGIGERSSAIRHRICAGLEHLGVRLDPRHDAIAEGIISATNSTSEVRIVRADEERTMARHTFAILSPRTV
jgi:acetate kinase